MIAGKRIAGGLVLGATVAVLAASATSVVGLQSTLHRCGADDPANKVKVSFDVPRVGDLSRYVPGIFENPELTARRDDPATIVIFDGPTRLFVVGNPRGTSVSGQTVGINSFDGVVCVVIGDFDVVYSDVDLSTIRLP